MNTKTANVYFYSRVSQTCIDLMKLMDAYGIRNKFLLRCVDDMDVIPPGLDRVPTLIIYGIPRPFVGNDAMKWFEDNKMYFAQQSAELQTKMHLYNMAKNAQDNNNPHGFSECEHGGLSDEFAYTDTDMSQPKSFVNYGNDGDIIVTPPKDSKLSISVQQRLIKDATNIRNDQEKEYAKMMKQDQINKLMMLEKSKLVNAHLGL